MGSDSDTGSDSDDGFKKKPKRKPGAAAAPQPVAAPTPTAAAAPTPTAGNGRGNKPKDSDDDDDEDSDDDPERKRRQAVILEQRKAKAAADAAAAAAAAGKATQPPAASTAAKKPDAAAPTPTAAASASAAAAAAPTPRKGDQKGAQPAAVAAAAAAPNAKAADSKAGGKHHSDSDEDGGADGSPLSPVLSEKEERKRRLKQILDAQKPLDTRQLQDLEHQIPADFFAETRVFNPFNQWERKRDQVTQLQGVVEKAVAAIVDSYHTGFHLSTAGFGNILQSFTESQNLVGTLGTHMVESKRLLQGRNSDLKDLWFQNAMYAQVIQILAKAEYIKTVPNQLDTFMRFKQYLHTVCLLKHARELLFSEELGELEALIDIRDELNNRKNAMQDILVDELVAHMYLKNDKQLEAVTNAAVSATSNSNATGGGGGGGGAGKGGGGDDKDDDHDGPAHPSTRSRGYSSVRSGGSGAIRGSGGASEDDVSEHSDDELSASFARRRSSDRRSDAEHAEFRSSLTNKGRGRGNSRDGFDPTTGTSGGGSSAAAIVAAAAAASTPTASSSAAAAAAAAGEPNSPQQFTRLAFASYEHARRVGGVGASAPLAAIGVLLEAEEREHFLKNPHANGKQFMLMLVEALDQIGGLPSVLSHINKVCRDELKRIIERETAVMKAKAMQPANAGAQAAAGAAGVAGAAAPAAGSKKRAAGAAVAGAGGNAVAASAAATAVAVAAVSSPRARGASLSADDSGRGSDLLIELIERLFAAFTAVLKNHIDVHTIITEKFAQRGLTDTSRKAGGGVNTPSSHGGGKNNMDDDDRPSSLNLSFKTPAPVSSTTRSFHVPSKGFIQDIWSHMQILLQIALCDYLQLQMNTLDRMTDKAKQARDRDEKDALDVLSFKFEDSMAPSIAKMSRKKKKDAALAAEDDDDQPSKRKDEKSGPPVPTAGAHALSLWIRGSPYHIVAAYRPVVQFTDQAYAMMNVGTGDPGTLRHFLSIFINGSFIPRVEADANLRVQDILEDNNAFSPREFGRDDGASGGGGYRSNGSGDTLVLMQSVIDIADLLKTMFADMFRLPHSVPEFIKIIENILSKFLDKCQDKYAEITRSLYSAQRLNDPKVIKQLQTDPLYQAIRGIEPTAEDDEKETIENFFAEHGMNHIYHELYTNQPQLKAIQLLFDSKKWSTVALLSESLEWLSDQLYQLTDPSSAAYTRNRNGAAGSTGGDSFGSGGGNRSLNLAARMAASSSAGSGGSGGSKSARKPNGSHWHSTRFGAAYHAPKGILEQKRYALADVCQQMADRALFSLRMEIHTHVFFFLHRMSQSCYWLPGEPNEPESWVIELNRDLTAHDDELSRYLPAPKLNYVFGGLAHIMTTTIRHGLTRLIDKRVNKNGVMQLNRNCFALQQNLTSIVITGGAAAAGAGAAAAAAAIQASAGNTDKLFDHARQYFELLNYTEDDLKQFIDEQTEQSATAAGSQRIPTVFSKEEYAALRDIKTPARMVRAGGGGKTPADSKSGR